MDNVHFSSKTDMWSTPQDTFDALAAEFGPFDLDVCATPENAKCPRYYTREDDGLAQPWTGRCFMNPPYGRTIGQWMKKAYEESQRGALVVCLVPARTDTAWFHSFVTKASQVRFLKGRLKFGGSANSAPFPSMIVVFGNAFDVAQGKVELFPSVQQVIRDPNPSVSSCGKFTESNSKFSLFEFSKFAWWHDYAMKGTITFLRGRLKFGGHKNAAPFPSAIVVFGGEVKQAKENP